MIVIRIWGGIGNQLFQYSFGEYLSQNYNQSVFYDINSFGKVDLLRNLELSIINPLFPVYYTSKYFFSNYKGIPNRIMRGTFLLKQNNRFIEESLFSEKNDILKDQSKLIYLQGYWQDEKYANYIKKKNNIFFQPKFETPKEIKIYRDTIEA